METERQPDMGPLRSKCIGSPAPGCEDVILGMVPPGDPQAPLPVLP
jgi:hypothetical protein